MTTLQHANAICRNKKGLPGFFYMNSGKDYYVSSYINYYYDYLLNKDGFFIPFNVLLKRDFEKEFFIRPDTGNKSFTGQVIQSKDDLFILKKLNPISDGEMVYVSSVKEVSEEWRVWICNRKIITYSAYSWGPKTSVLKDIPDSILTMAENLTKETWQPDLAYVADFCVNNGKPFLVEINSVSTSGVYDADLYKILEALNQVINDELQGFICHGE